MDNNNNYFNNREFSNTTEALFYTFFYYAMIGDIEEARNLYLSYFEDKSIYHTNALLVRYFYLEDDETLLIDYLNENNISLEYIKYYKSLKQCIKDSNISIFLSICENLTQGLGVEDDFLSDICNVYLVDDVKDILYLHDSLNYTSDTEKEILESQEEDLLFHVMENDFNQINSDLISLKQNYPIVLHDFLNVIYIFNIKIKGLKDGSIDNLRCSKIFSGTQLAVIKSLIGANDFYRARDVIESLDHASMEYLLLHEMINNAISFIKEREVNEKIDMFASVQGVEDMIELLPYGEISRYDMKFIDFIESIISLENGREEVNTSINYYSLYETAYLNGDYLNAYKYILMFRNRIELNEGYKRDIDYLINDCKAKVLNFLTGNKYLQIYYDRIYTCVDYEDWQGVLENISLYNSISRFIDPKIICLFAYATFEKGDYERTIEYYETVGRGYLEPDDYKYLMEASYRLGDFDRVLKYGKIFNEYEKDSDVFVNYMMSSAYLILGYYEEALNMIRVCRELNDLFYSTMGNTYNNEEEIILGIQYGENLKPFTIDDFVDFNLSLEEEQYELDLLGLDDVFNLSAVQTEMKKFKSREDKIEYMLSVLKILTVSERSSMEDINLLADYTDSFIANSDINSDTKEIFTFKLKNYKNL